MNHEPILSELHSELQHLLAEFGKAKSFNTEISLNGKFQVLIEKGILDSTKLSLIYEHPNALLIGAALTNQQSFPSTSLNDLQQSHRNVIQAANKRGITSNTYQFGKHFTKDLIITSFSSSENLAHEILKVQKGDPHIHLVADPFFISLSSLPVKIDLVYRMARHIYNFIYEDGGHIEVFSNIQMLATDNHKIVYSLAKEDIQSPGFLANLLVGEYKGHSLYFWQELDELQAKGNVKEAITAILNVTYETKEEVTKAVSFLEKCAVTDENINDLIWAYCSLINNKLLHEETRRRYLLILEEKAKIKNALTLQMIIRNIRGLQVDNTKKLKILKQMDFSITGGHMLGHAIEDFNAGLFLDVLIYVGLANGMLFRADDYEHYIKKVFEREKVEFSTKLTDLLTHPLGRVRFVATRLLQEINEDSFPPVFEINISDLSLQKQLILIYTLPIDVLKPKAVIYYLLQFRKVNNAQVQQEMVNELSLVVQDHLSTAMETFRSILTDASDTKMLSVWEKYYKDLQDLIEARNEVRELDPNRNDALNAALFNRLYKKRFQEQFTSSQNESPLFSMVHKVSIARGKYWKIGGNDKAPSELSLISSNFALPRLMMLNPDECEWRAKVRINANYEINE
ncbi:MAG: hypothetical protein ACKO96_36335 [Flammeovirgaceae bacterium]